MINPLAMQEPIVISMSRPGNRSRGYQVDLISHMAECDANYHRMLQLMPGLADQDVHGFELILSDRAAAVKLRVVERCPYTTLVELEQQQMDAGLQFALPAPRMQVRLYHDARNAEVVEYQGVRRLRPKYTYPNPGMRQRDEKIQVNRFLGEYLAACLAHGSASQLSLAAVGG